MRDPYEILGVQKNATPAAIKSAFRRLAKKLHPDANKTDKTAATKFSELNAAYEILGDDDKRKAFDRGEIDAEGKPRFQGFGGGAGRGRGPVGRGRRPVRTATSKASPGVRTASSVGGGGRAGGFRGGGGIDDILKEMFGGAAGGGRRSQFEPEEFGGAAARPRRHRHRHHHAAGGFDRHVPARASADRQGDRRQEFRPVSPTARPSG